MRLPLPPAHALPDPLPSLADLTDDLVVVGIPLRTRFRGIDVREAVVFRGPSGWGEFAPFPEYDDAEATRWLAAGIEAAWVGWPPAVRDAVEVNATVPAVDAARVPEVLARFPGCTTAKVKVGGSGRDPQVEVAEDLARVRAVREHLGRAGKVRVDANASWTVPDAEARLTALADVGLEYAEQPVASVPELAELRARLRRAGVPVPIAADESIRRAEDPLAVARAGAADLVVVKVPPLGGVRAASEIVQACGLPAVVSSALDTSVGIAAGVALAASLPGSVAACGLGTVALFTDDVVAQSLAPQQGALPVMDAAPAPDPRRVAALALPEPRRRWWEDRVARVHALVTEQGRR